MADIRINEFTDPGCPWAWRAEPVRRRIEWLYGDRIEWRVHLVGLSDTTLPACGAVVAVRERVSERAARALLRQLRIRHLAGASLDDPQTIADAVVEVGLDAGTVAGWCADAHVGAALSVDLAAARQPIPAARVLDDKLANWSGGRRYTSPSYEIKRRRDGVEIAIPGFQPFAVHDVILANLIPDMERRRDPASAEEALAWAGEPLTTDEVALLLDCSPDEARVALDPVARATPLGDDVLWTPRRYTRLSIAPSTSEAPATTASAPASSVAG